MASNYINIPSGVSTYTRDLSDLDGCKVTIAFQDSVLNYDVSHCGEFGAYYVNSMGGWDSFLFEGKCKRADGITRHQIEKSFKNTSIDFERNTYISELELGYELSTGWMTDEQSARFAKELVESNMLYIHDLVNDRIFPAVITNDRAEFKKWTDNRRMVSHTITVVDSQKRVRR